MEISQGFDGGNITVIECEEPSNIQLEIRKDNNSDFYQWFYFRLSGARNRDCTIKILNAGDAAYPDGFKDYRIVYSYDRKEWLRHDSQLEHGVLEFRFTAKKDAVYFSYFAPYSMKRHHDLVASALGHSHCSHELLGKTLDNQDLDLLRFSNGDDAAKKNCWIIARQHPGETMAEWWMEGCIEKLCNKDDPLTQKILANCNVYLIPNMNPDGSRRGHLRTNAAGRNLNREWASPTLELSPEVFLAKEKMNFTGVDFFLDVHGDEALPYCFIAGTEGLKGWNDSKQADLDFYKRRLAEVNPDFQTEKGYPPNLPGKANLTMSTCQTASLHDCLAMTLEMPFKDTTATPNEKYGWSGERSKKLAHSCIQVMAEFMAKQI
ncbi:MAG: M14-type cytosolic carboxypeptidase [Gammaproteobacteria bacterium]|nr:M14-type cytosolic carboxypeptidase [Gammaproteobacteria bacterium]MDD9895205.1 M14-type cytosolic carboxypeptidase [Gammaproteobacteria bacterium]MDD9958913.1 M14-type cytosolic carboxypeptidase [Gammaproteobacteria bacterium]